MVNKKVQEIFIKLFKENNLSMYSEKNASNILVPDIYILESLENMVFISKEACEKESNFRQKNYILQDYVKIIEDAEFFDLFPKCNFIFNENKYLLKVMNGLLLNIPLKDVKKANLFGTKNSPIKWGNIINFIENSLGLEKKDLHTLFKKYQGKLSERVMMRIPETILNKFSSQEDVHQAFSSFCLNHI